ncbi:hypothetical protein EIM50_22515 [Pseudoxanthomonas sp. SGD-10]|nr:hypothetical protein EIM50_22515 [Pseudoxanthomonas sp. SGD-10]
MADLDASNSSSGNSMIAVTQQLSVSLGVSLSSLLLATIHQMDIPSASEASAFKYTFIILGVVTAVASLVFTRLKETDGDKLSGHHKDSLE